MIPKFNRPRFLYNAFIPKFHNPIFTPSEVIMLTNKQTHKQTDAAENATMLGNVPYFTDFSTLTKINTSVKNDYLLKSCKLNIT